MATISVSKTYDVVTEESAEYGDFAESGFEFQSVPYTFRELVDEMREYMEPSCSPIGENDFWVTSEASQDYRTGDYTSYSLHFDRDQPERLRRFWRLAWEASRAR